MRPACIRSVASLGQLEGVERPVPRRRPQLLPWRRGAVARLADRLVGSPEIYGHEEREAEQSVNFVTCHDGFTLNDLVSYDQKHNDATARATATAPTITVAGTVALRALRMIPPWTGYGNRQVKNFLTVTPLSVGMPMLLMGDEVRRTQGGNNNAYCQDNDELVRLDAGGEACRCAPVRDPVQRATAVARLGAERQRTSLNQPLRGRTRPGTARNSASQTGARPHTALRSPPRSGRSSCCAT